MNPLTAFFAPYKLWIEIAVLVSVIGGAVWGVHRFLSYEQQIGYDKAEAIYAKQLVAAQQAAAEKQKEMQDRLDLALKGAADREQTIKTTSAAAAAASASLRDTLRNLGNGVSVATVDSLRKSTATLASVLGDCSDRYRGLAEKADRHASDTRTLIEAWPK